MQLHEIWKEIIESHEGYWNYIPRGPLFNYNLGTSNGAAWVAGYHDARAVLLHDVDIALEFGMDSNIWQEREPAKPEWAPFADREVFFVWCDIMYRGSLVDRVELASVDGGRATLPFPEKRDGEWIVMDRPYHLARVIDDIQGGREFEEYFERSGIRKWPA
ncbi:hypothetical protein FBY40_1601 [Microbacterium sp. SLBN-154]|uniref:hypothetical protein n=1 Tax=Microbacterium sp. SLBN-154 TaxID=2768458 RepID=UPI001152BCA4|nr:hypothetical protein [Microbacterium sp. SLBN-154]TQK19110.1 hypothetical protein FBY40_1601 [Microbacterium sp. SLBN-154]